MTYITGCSKTDELMTLPDLRLSNKQAPGTNDYDRQAHYSLTGWCKLNLSV